MQQSIILAAMALAVGGLLYAESGERTRLRWVFKPAAALLFVMLAVSSGAAQTAFGRTILVGLALCAAGDVLLIPKGRGHFLAGMAAFAAGHLAYFAAFLRGGVAIDFAVAATALLFGAVAVALIFRLRRGLRELLVPVALYAAIIGAMVVASVAHGSAAPSGTSAALIAAAVGFALSDISVARDRFGAAGFANRVWGLPLYFASQCLFAISV